MAMDCVVAIFLALMRSRKHRSVEENFKSMEQAANVLLEQEERQQINISQSYFSVTMCDGGASAGRLVGSIFR